MCRGTFFHATKQKGNIPAMREEGLSHREIATRTSISIHTVEQLMSLALKALQKEFRHFQYNETAILAILVAIAWEA